MKRPVIGVFPLMDIQRKSQWMLPGYLEGIEASGGVPVVFPLTGEEEEMERLYDLCDGFLFTGGQDVDPAVYGEKRTQWCGEICKERDQMEKYFYRRSLLEDRPMLGICRGIQFMNVLGGGTLYQDILKEHPSDIVHHQEPPYDVPAHEVRILQETPLSELLCSEKIEVNSYHHQAIKEMGDGFLSMAISPDGLVEAIYKPDKKFVWAVQWHPELSFRRDENSRRIFERFVESCSGSENS